MTQPTLPESFPWPAQTREWWSAWSETEGFEEFTAADWQYLLDTALVHADVWGNWNLDRMPELRQRVQRFGVTPEDRKRLGLAQKGGTKVDPLDEIAARRSARGVPAARQGGPAF